MQITFFSRPHGKQESIDIREVEPDDAAWFAANNVRVSMEPDGCEGWIVYGDDGRMVEGEPDEAIEFSGGRTCRQTLAALRQQLQARKE